MKTRWTIAALASAIWLGMAWEAVASDPAGQWSTCVDQTGSQTIIVEGGSCPYGWRKIY